MRDELRVQAELRDGRGKVEGPVRILAGEELLRGVMGDRDDIGVVALAEKQGHRGQEEGGEREPGRERVADTRAKTDHREDRKTADDDEGHQIVGRDDPGLDNEVPLDDRGHGDDGEDPEADAAETLVVLDGAAIDERGDEIEERQDRRKREHRWKGVGERRRTEEAERRGPEGEASDGERTEHDRRREVAKIRGQHIQPDREGISVQREHRDHVGQRREPEAGERSPPRRPDRRREDDEPEIERVPDRERQVGAGLVDRAAHARRRHDAGRRQDERRAEQRVRGHETDEGSDRSCQ